MKKIILKATVLAAAMAWASASFAGSGIYYSLYLKVENTGSGDQVSWSTDGTAYVAAQRTDVFAESSSWLVDMAGGQPFYTGGTFSGPVSFFDETRAGYFDIVRFLDPTRLKVDVRQATSLGIARSGPAFDTDPSTSANYNLNLYSSGTEYTNAVPVPEPSSYALMLLGLVAAGVAAKRRKAKQA